MKYVTVGTECKMTDNGMYVKEYREKKLDAGDKMCIAGLVISLAILFLSIGYYAGTKMATTETKQVATEVTEEVTEDIYSEEVPLNQMEQQALYDASQEFNVDYYTMLGLIEKETNFRNVSGDSGKATGYCQIWKVYWKDLMHEIGASDLTVSEDNFRTACAIVSELQNRYGSLAGALTAYNKGSYDGTVSKYAISVLENAEKWRTA